MDVGRRLREREREENERKRGGRRKYRLVVRQVEYVVDIMLKKE